MTLDSRFHLTWYRDYYSGHRHVSIIHSFIYFYESGKNSPYDERNRKEKKESWAIAKI